MEIYLPSLNEKQNMPACAIDSESTAENAELKELLSKFVKDPTDALICDHIGEYYLKSKRYNHAIAYLEKAHQLDPQLSIASTHLAILKTIREASLKTLNQEQQCQASFSGLHSYSEQQTILFVGEYLFPTLGGAEKSALTLLYQLVRDGHRCIAICKGDGPEIESGGVLFCHVPNLIFIEQLLHKIKPTLILTEITWASYAIPLAKKHHIPSILFVWSLEYFCATPVELTRCDKKCAQCTVHKYNRTIRNRCKAIVNGAGTVVCNSEFTRRVTFEFYGREAQVLYPSINLSDFQAHRISGTFIVMNQTDYHKGGEIFFSLAEKMKEFKFMTVGRGKSRELPNCICYGQTDPHIFLQHAKLLLVPSIWPEPFGRIAVEAMSNGIPVIASNCGGLPEIIGDAGILIDDFHNVAEWEKQIRTVLENKNLYAELSLRAAERSQQFDSSVQLELMRQIINDAVELKKESSDRRILDFYNKRYEKHATYAFLFNQRRERLEGLCNMINKGEYYLDIGCADGAHMEVLHLRGIEGIGIDVSIPNILRGMNTFPHLHFVHGFAEKIPFFNQYFDVALMGDILEHLRDPHAVIREVFRVANALAICVPIGGKTLEHINPYSSIESVVSLFNGMNVKMQWFSTDGRTICIEDLRFSDERPWVYIRVERMKQLSLISSIVDENSIDYETKECEEVRDEWNDRTVSRDFQEITRFHCIAELVEGPAVLEMACGNGDMSVVIARKNYMLHGIDLKKKGIERANKTARAQKVSQNVVFETGDAAQSGFPEEHFNTVIIPELVEHIKDPHLIIREALRVAKREGLILISVPDGPDPNPDHIRCFFKETLKVELSQYTDEITWYNLPFKRWLIVTFRKKNIHSLNRLTPFEKTVTIKENHKNATVNNIPLPGFNIIGPVGAGNEFGARIRGLIQLLLECGFPVSVKELLTDGQQVSVNPFKSLSFSGAELPYAINCFCLHPLMINQVFSSAPSWLRLNNRYNVCLPDLASPEIKEMWFDQFNRMDAILVVNSGMEKIIRNKNPSVKVLMAEIPPYIHKKGHYQRENLGIPEDVFLFVTFVDLLQSPISQQVDIIIETFKTLQPGKKHLSIVLDCTSGMVNEHYNNIKKMVGSEASITVHDGLIGREDTQSFFDMADAGINVTLLNAPSPWIMEMMANGKIVIAADIPVLSDVINEKNALVVPFVKNTKIVENEIRIDKKVLLFQISHLLENHNFCIDIGWHASTTIKNMQEKMISGGTADLVFTMSELLSLKRTEMHMSKKRERRKSLKVLLINRIDLAENPGKNIRIMEQIKDGLERKGHEMYISSGLPDTIGQYDIVHAFNATHAAFTDACVERAIHDSVPFILTPLQEDFPRFLNKSIMTFRIFEKYLDMGQPGNFFDKQYEMVDKQASAPFLTSPLALSHAAAVLVSGKEEASVIKRYFPSARIMPGPFGFSFKNNAVDSHLFVNEYKLKDFVLCVGQLDMRKNQLMLLKALEMDTIPIVFIGGDSDNNNSYTRLCKEYRRSGPTLFLERISDEMLASAFDAAKVHCLPSWYELPGFATIEAAGYGCPVVQSSWGTIGDYCGNYVTKCEPDNYHSIRNAVLESMEKEKNSDIVDKLKNYTSWEKAADCILDAYNYAIENGNNSDEPERASNDNRAMKAMIDPARLMDEVTKLVENRKFKEGVILYETNRHNVVNIPELVKFDELMKKVKIYCRM
jgi:glycosyltransferase involved in cell wall biosynthesis